MQIAVACGNVHGIRKEMKRGNRGEQGAEGERESVREKEKWRTWRGRPCFSKAFVFLNPTGRSSRLPGRGDRLCDMPPDAAKVDKINIWPLG